MPTPHSGESESDYVSRCMASSEMQSEYPDQQQRAAVCYSKYANKSMANKDLIPGGKGDNRPITDFDKDQLAAGIKVEMEHTGDVQRASEIARDHLTEDPDYYKKLTQAGLAQKSDGNTKVHFRFHPLHPEQGMHTVEKAEGGTKRRYLYGISSGPRVDGHGERMTQKCIEDFQRQANSGDLLLYPSVHGIKDIDDVGILTKCEINKDGDWVTEYRLYDSLDGVDETTLDKCDKIWKQINGLPPYKKPRQKGFSIEGNVRSNGIVYQSAGGQRVLDAIDLDGVVIVPRPAYKDSIAHAVYKALGETPPWVVKKNLQAKLAERLQVENTENQYYRKKYLLNDALEQEVCEIMCSPDIGARAQALNDVFDEYKGLMIELIQQSASLFQPEMVDTVVVRGEAGINKSEVLKSLANQLPMLQTLIQKRITKSK